MAPFPTTGDVSTLVETMFADVFTSDERATLLERIHEWERENPDVDAAHRVTGWIDVAYAYQEQLDRAAPTPAAKPARIPATSWGLGLA